MNTIIFHEKPGCAGNAQQKQFLRDRGYDLVVENLLETVWTASALRSYFGETPVESWFNQSSPRVKAQEISIGSVSEQEAIHLMIEDPLLICRPLLRCGEFRQSGFISGPVFDHLGIALGASSMLQYCPIAANRSGVAT